MEIYVVNLMTVCIAALAENKKRAIVLADQMITARIPVAVEYETEDVTKMYELAHDIYALSAGDALHANKIITNAQKQIRQRGFSSSSENISIEDVVEIVRVEYQNHRRNVVTRLFVETRGLTLRSYYDAHSHLNPRIINDIDDKLNHYDINVEFIIVGLSTDSECHIYTVTHPGISTQNDVLGYISVGSGGPHAMYAFIYSGYSKQKSLEEVKNIVLQAKKFAEKAPGVGEQSVIKVIPNTTQEKPVTP